MNLNQVQPEKQPSRSAPLPRWLKMILDWRANRRKKELAKLDAELARLNNELVAAQMKNTQLEQLKKSVAALERGEPVRLGDTVYDMSVARYHGRRDDGSFVSVYLDGMAESADSSQMLASLNAEACRLRAAGHTVL